jgi:hypothetical protein
LKILKLSVTNTLIFVSLSSIKVQIDIVELFFILCLEVHYHTILEFSLSLLEH